MERDPRAYLWDVQQAADAIEDFIGGLDAGDYAQNRLIRAAVERQFEIIGEATEAVIESLSGPRAEGALSSRNRGVSQCSDPWLCVN